MKNRLTILMTMMISFVLIGCAVTVNPRDETSIQNWKDAIAIYDRDAGKADLDPLNKKAGKAQLESSLAYEEAKENEDDGED